MSQTQYAQRDTESLGNTYIKHVEAMTAEGLHAKSAIAAELAWRDDKIEKLESLVFSDTVGETPVAAMRVCTYNGGHFGDLVLEKKVDEYGHPYVPVVIRNLDGVDLCLGEDQGEDKSQPSVLCERQPDRWMIAIGTQYGGDHDLLIYVMDNMKIYVVPDRYPRDSRIIYQDKVPPPTPGLEPLPAVAKLAPQAAIQTNGEVTVIKAYGGDRAKNLDAMADDIDGMLSTGDQTGTALGRESVRKIRGYAEQMRIIADEIRNKK